MNKISVLGLFAVLLVGITSTAVAENYNWDDKYREIEREYEEKRHQIDRHYQDQFEQIEKEYEERKLAIYQSTENDSTVSESEVDAMWNELFLEFEEKRRNLEFEMMQEFRHLEEMFEKEIRNVDEEARNYYEREMHYEDEEYYENDPEWQSIEPLAQKIMDVISIEKIQTLWEDGEIDRLIELIVSETDMTYEEAKKVVLFFEKYDKQEHDNYQKQGHYREDEYQEQYSTSYNDGEILRLEQKITELEEENKMLRQTITELEERITQINAVVMEQVKFIYEWVLSQ